jgi:hypothetical protein
MRTSTSAADIIITGDMLARAPAPTGTISNADVNAIFRRLRALLKRFGRKRHSNEAAEALIGACIVEGFATRWQIVGALARLEFKAKHIHDILNRFEGDDASLHRWRCEDGERYRLL